MPRAGLEPMSCNQAFGMVLLLSMQAFLVFSKKERSKRKIIPKPEVWEIQYPLRSSDRRRWSCVSRSSVIRYTAYHLPHSFCDYLIFWWNPMTVCQTEQSTVHTEFYWSRWCTQAPPHSSLLPWRCWWARLALFMRNLVLIDPYVCRFIIFMNWDVSELKKNC